MSLNILRNCDLLSENKKLENLYELTCGHEDVTAALWLENGQEKSYTYAQYRKMTDNYAAYLANVFPADGSYVAVSMETSKEWFPTFWGLIRSGHNVLMLDSAMPDNLAAYLMEQAGCSKIIVGKKRDLNEDIQQLLAADLFAAPEVDGFTPTLWGDSMALCTSGTTGTSRIFVYNGEAICDQVLILRRVHQENPRIVDNINRRALAFLPYHHVLGLIANLLWCSFVGYANIYIKDRAPQTILAAAKAFKPNVLISVPLLANNLCTALNKKLAKESLVKRAAFKTMQAISLGVQRISPKAGLNLAQKKLFRGILENLLGTEMDVFILGGSHTPAENLRLLNSLGYYTICGFGMTETAITSFETSMNLSTRINGCVGKPLTNMEYVTRDGAETGEMLIRGKTMHSGRMVGGKLLPPDLEDGWYPTGDIVRMDKDGRVFIVGRCKDIIINESGENVYPDELEDLFTTLPHVEQFTVLGLSKGQDTPYEDIALVMNVGASLTDGHAMKELAAAVTKANQVLPAMKRVSRALVTDEKLPLVNGIKVKRLELKRQLESGGKVYTALELKAGKALAAQTAPEPKPQADQPAKPEGDKSMDEIRAKVRVMFAEALDEDVSKVDDNAHFIDDLGGDSLQVLSIVLKVEESFGVLIDTEEYGRCATINSLTQVIREKLSGGAAVNTSVVVAERKPITRFEDTPEYAAFMKRVEDLNASGDGNPYFVTHDSALLDKSNMAGQEVLNFGSYNYVGMSGRKEVQEAAKEAIDKYGTSASGSRLLAGEKTLHQELEKEIAEWKHAEAALVCVGGHSTNVTFVGNFCGKNDLIVYDALAHNSIEQGCKLSSAVAKPFPHNDPAALESILRTQRNNFEKVLIVIEGAYSMDGDIADVPAFVRLKKQYGCFLMVDEAHSACVIGKTGGGVDEYFNLAPDDVDIKMGTLSKGLGTCGGYLAGKKCLIEYLRYSMPGFVFSVGLSPALAAGSLEAVRLLRREPSIMEGMARNIRIFAEEARKRKLDICLAGETAILPVLVGPDDMAFALSNELRRRGVFVPPAVYPAVPKNRARLRFCVISEHKPEQIVYALDTLLEAAKDLGIQLPQREYE
ncbi:MAG: aminotransferase class I/II-fold pyridoxal phosphate-dependent enzyme [Clostridia bacterium]|nr:aminotransferase class I/II-fold pyridoxal phosphate-dependent enzyme [Clostridia bacterium]